MKNILYTIILSFLFSSAYADSAKDSIVLIEKEVQVLKVFYQKSEGVEWKVVVNGDRYLNSDGSVSEYKNIQSELKNKGWNGFAMALCNILHETGYIKENNKKNHIIRIVDLETLKKTNTHWRKSSVGSCNCKTWEPFD